MYDILAYFYNLCQKSITHSTQTSILWKMVGLYIKFKVYTRDIDYSSWYFVQTNNIIEYNYHKILSSYDYVVVVIMSTSSYFLGYFDKFCSSLVYGFQIYQNIKENMKMSTYNNNDIIIWAENFIVIVFDNVVCLLQIWNIIINVSCIFIEFYE